MINDNHLPHPDFGAWSDYYDGRRDHFDHIGYGERSELTTSEKHRVASALQQFQRGEDSDGHHLMGLSEKMGDTAYTASIRGLISEEQRHAAALGKFMDIEGIDRVNEHWLDNLFKRFIRTRSLTATIAVLLSAELIAAVFYRALAAATRSNTLKRICEQILVDEEAHIRFQSEALMVLRSRLNPLQKLVFFAARPIFMAGTALVAWWQFRRVFRDGGYHFASYFLQLAGRYLRTAEIIYGYDESVPTVCIDAA